MFPFVTTEQTNRPRAPTVPADWRLNRSGSSRDPRQHLADIAAELPESTWTWAGDHALILNLVNSVGVLELPHLGTLELVTRKFGQRPVRRHAAGTDRPQLPPSHSQQTKRTAGRYSVITAPRDEVLYHAFVYLRYILSDRAPEEVRLLPALEMIVREPHRLWRSHRRDVRIEAMTRVDAHTPLDLVTRPGGGRGGGVTLALGSEAR